MLKHHTLFYVIHLYSILSNYFRVTRGPEYSQNHSEGKHDYEAVISQINLMLDIFPKLYNRNVCLYISLYPSGPLSQKS